MTDAVKEAREVILAHLMPLKETYASLIVDDLVAAVRAETLRETQTAPCGCPCRGECK